MIKIVSNTWDFNEAPIQVFSKKNNWLKKQASWYDKYEPDPLYTYALALFLGAGDAYGCNRNGDYFKEGDLIETHQTFETDGKHFKHHENDDPTKCYGDIAKSFYNPVMRRVEGIIRIENSKSPEMVYKINKGIPVPLSMACKVKFDICSICGNKAKTVELYCDDLKNNMCKILEDGRQVFAINPKPRFFDISEVVKGADKTAFTLKKVASLTNSSNDHLLTKSNAHINKSSNISKLSILQRLASIEKQIDGWITEGHPSLKYLLRELPTVKKIDNVQEKIGSFSKAGVAITPKDLGLEKSAGKNMMYRALLENDNRDNLLNFVPENNSLIDFPLSNDIINGRSLLSKHACLRGIDNSDKQVRCKASLNKGEVDLNLLKVAALNLAIIANNKELLEDNSFSKLIILQGIFN